jgi:tetratricopeptide (TPR) repeat protein
MSQVETENVLDLLSSLVDKSLVAYDEDEHGRGRYRLLETVKQYGREHLIESGEMDAVRGQHRDKFLSLAKCAKSKIQGPGQIEWLDQLEGEHDNLRAALDWCLQDPEGAQPGLNLAADLFFLWWIRGYFTEGQSYFYDVLDRVGADAPTAARAKALSRAGSLFSICSDPASAQPLFEEGLAIARDLGDRKAEANLLCNLGDVAIDSRPDEARAFLERSLAIHREIGNKSGIAHASLLLGNVALRQNRSVEAQTLFAESLALNRALGNPQKTGHALWCLARCCIDEQHYAEGQALLEECMMLFRKLRDPWSLSAALALAGEAALRSGEYAQAPALLTEHLRLVIRMGLNRSAPWMLRCFGRLAAARAKWERGARLFGAASSLEETNSSLLPTETTALEATQAALSAEAFNTAWDMGKAMTLEQAAEYALAGDAQ